MKYTDTSLLLKAYIKVSVDQSIKKVYFKDVQLFKKIKRRSMPKIPSFDGRSSWFAFEEAIDDWVDITTLAAENKDHL